MEHFQKLASIIEELEQQSDAMKGFNSVYIELERLKNEIAKSVNFFDAHNKEIKNLSLEIQTKIEDYTKKNTQIFEEIKETLRNSSTKIQSQMNELYDDNKRFQKELDSSIITRLDKNRYDIQIDFRNENEQSQKKIEYKIESKIQSVEKILESRFQAQKKETNFLKKIIVFLVFLNIGQFILVFAK